MSFGIIIPLRLMRSFLPSPFPKKNKKQKQMFFTIFINYKFYVLLFFFYDIIILHANKITLFTFKNDNLLQNTLMEKRN